MENEPLVSVIVPVYNTSRYLEESFRPKCGQTYRENHIYIMHSHFELYDIPTTTTAPKEVKIFCICIIQSSIIHQAK